VRTFGGVSSEVLQAYLLEPHGEQDGRIGRQRRAAVLVVGGFRDGVQARCGALGGRCSGVVRGHGIGVAVRRRRRGGGRGRIRGRSGGGRVGSLRELRRDQHVLLLLAGGGACGAEAGREDAEVVHRVLVCFQAVAGALGQQRGHGERDGHGAVRHHDGVREHEAAAVGNRVHHHRGLRVCATRLALLELRQRLQHHTAALLVVDLGGVEHRVAGNVDGGLWRAVDVCGDVGREAAGAGDEEAAGSYLEEVQRQERRIGRLGVRVRAAVQQHLAHPAAGLGDEVDGVVAGLREQQAVQAGDQHGAAPFEADEAALEVHAALRRQTRHREAAVGVRGLAAVRRAGGRVVVVERLADDLGEQEQARGALGGLGQVQQVGLRLQRGEVVHVRFDEDGGLRRGVQRVDLADGRAHGGIRQPGALHALHEGQEPLGGSGVFQRHHDASRIHGGLPHAAVRVQVAGLVGLRVEKVVGDAAKEAAGVALLDVAARPAVEDVHEGGQEGAEVLGGRVWVARDEVVALLQRRLLREVGHAGRVETVLAAKQLEHQGGAQRRRVEVHHHGAGPEQDPAADEDAQAQHGRAARCAGDVAAHEAEAAHERLDGVGALVKLAQQCRTREAGL
jgi:hypothetical protein